MFLSLPGQGKRLRLVGIMQYTQRKTIIFIHHAGKNGNQRGTSKREDILDNVVVLKRPSDYEPGEGARFEVHFEKARHLHGKNVEPFVAKLTQDEKRNQTWETEVTPKNRTGSIESFLV